MHFWQFPAGTIDHSQLVMAQVLVGYLIFRAEPVASAIVLRRSRNGQPD